MLCELSLQEAKLEKSDLQGVMLVGGSTRVPKIIESVKTTFGMEPIDTANVDEVVALGAALYAAYKSDKVNLNAIQKKSIEKIKIGEKTGKTYGTLAISNDNVQREYRDINSILIEKNKKIPCAVTKPFYTTHSNQTRLTCTVTESITPETDPKFVDVLWEGELNLPEGRPDHQEIKISFSYDDNQIMHCEFTDIETGRKTEVDIQMGSSDDDANNDNDPNKFLIE
jgi:molecular chaperone DnaK